MTWKAYSITPIDFGWEMLPIVEEVAAKFARVAATQAVAGHGSDGGEVSSFLKDFENAKRLASKAGWEGDYRGGSEPRVFWLPGENDFSYGFVWKHDNNGDTFVISPRPLGWLSEWENG
jgi:hypothetical protein